MFPLLQLFFQGFLQCSISMDLKHVPVTVVSEIAFKIRVETTIGRLGEVN
jgi:hypothetical protein